MGGYHIAAWAASVAAIGMALGPACTSSGGSGASSCTRARAARVPAPTARRGSQVCQSNGTYEACKCTGSGSSGGSGSGGSGGGSSSGSSDAGPDCSIVCDIENGSAEATSTTYWAEQGLGGGGNSDLFGIYADGTIASLRTTSTLGASSGCYYGAWTGGSDGFTTTGWPSSLSAISVAGGSVASGAVTFTATDNEGNVHAPVTFHLENTIGKSPFAGCVPSGDAGPAADGAADAGCG